MQKDLFPLNVYFAGAVFNHKELAGNALLADKIGKVSGGRYRCLLPQDVDARQASPAEIRNHCFLQLLKSDGGLFNFDGVELDSGTVAEFMLARNSLDLPAVVWRGDFRASGDQGNGGEPWNLMLSGYPRTESVVDMSALSYLTAKDKQSSPAAVVDEMLTDLAMKLASALDKAFTKPSASFLKTEEDYLRMVERYIENAGSGFKELISNEDIKQIARRKLKTSSPAS